MVTNPTSEEYSDEFDTLLAQSIEKSNLKEGSVIKGIITESARSPSAEASSG